MDISRSLIKWIHAQHQGLLSSQEKKELRQWLKEDRNRKLYDEYLKIYHQTREVGIYNEVNIDKAWEKLNCKIQNKKNTIRMRWIAAATAFAACLTLLFLFENDVSQQVRLEDIQEVTLKTENKFIEVEKIEDSVIIEIEGTQLLKKDNQLVYIESKKTQKSELNTLLVPRGKEYQLTLSDGTKLWVNSESNVVFPTVFNDKERRICLKSGEIFLDVIHNPKRPFIVHTNGIDIEVLGTRFNVNAYADNSNLCVTLEHGSVRIVNTNKTDATQAATYISPGEQLTLDLSSNKLEIRKVDVSISTAWIRGEYYFEDEDLQTILNVLSRWYDCNITYTTEAIKDIKYTGWIRKHVSIESFLHALESLEGISFELKDDGVILK